MLLLTFCLLLLPLWESVIVICFVVRYFMSILVLQSSWWGRESWLLCLICLPGVLWWLSGSSSRCHWVVCSLWLRYFLIILTYYFYYFNKRSLHLFLFYPLKNENFNQNVIHWTITLITPLSGIVHFKTNYNYRLSYHCFINKLILVTYALISRKNLAWLIKNAKICFKRIL